MAVDESRAEELRSGDKVPVFNGTHPLGRPRGVFLDEEELREAERRRAIVEDREPDYSPEGLSAGSAGVPLVNAAQILAASPLHGGTQALVVDAVVKSAMDSDGDVEPFTTVDAHGDLDQVTDGSSNHEFDRSTPQGEVAAAQGVYNPSDQMADESRSSLVEDNDEGFKTTKTAPKPSDVKPATGTKGK